MTSELPFTSIHRHGFVRIAAARPAVAIADPATNATSVLELVRKAEGEGADLVVFPELCVSAYAIDDLHLQQALLDQVEAALTFLIRESTDVRAAFVVGAPLRRNGRLYNCAVVIHSGRAIGVVPKSFLPNYREFYEKRWFASGRD